MTAALGASRYDVITQVFTSQADLELAAGLLPGESVSQRLLEARARRGENGYGMEASADVVWQLSEFLGLSIGYGYQQRLSDDRDRGDQAIHRVLAGVTLSTEQVAPAESGVY